MTQTPAFPLHRRRKLVKGIARILESKNREDANAFLAQHRQDNSRSTPAGTS
ncbi:hypothetical protein [Mesorhizobium sp. M0159]|uniref:DUF6074 family protein n=1 Tax=unclassified Mesorhizobium TaxID=325217 RepID=UPI003339C9B5